MLPDTEYISRDDESEAARLAQLNGVGEVIYTDDDVRQYSINDFGMGIKYSDKNSSMQ